MSAGPGVVPALRCDHGDIVMVRGAYVVVLGQVGREVWVRSFPSAGWCVAMLVPARSVKVLPGRGTIRSCGWGIN